MALLLVRHARAGKRGNWAGPDDERPLSGRGHRQAKELVALLADRPIDRVLSSPFVRCTQTVEPLAAELDLTVEPLPVLSEGAAVVGMLELADALVATEAVACSHGDTIPELLEALVERDGLDLPRGYPCAKGSTWVLEPEDGRYRRASYLPPPV